MYGDFSCPFSFALTERIKSIGSLRSVEWRGVQHRPNLPSPAESLVGADLSDLLDELRRLAQVEPRLAIWNQGLRPNSGLATRIVAAVRRSQPGREWEVITAFYRALWKERRDISNGQVVAEVLSECSLSRPDFLIEAEHDIRTWQTEWAESPSQHRLPMLNSDRGATLTGLGTRERLRLFLASGLFTPHQLGETCMANFGQPATC
jgi:predicted DsbA family dithiol-disulfide isomerase